MANKIEQIEALLNHRAYDLATKELEKSNMARSSYEDVFTVTRKEIDAYVKDNGIPEHVYCTIDGPHMCEGIHLVKRGSKWHLFWLERGIESEPELFENDFEAKKSLLDWILNTAGTGIDFTQQGHSR
jgi:hypothetical protein